ncbi:MAG: diguanylate cyclase [Burkholderiales bacterium]
MASKPGAGRPRVLIIDDSKFVRTTFRRILESSLEVREEADGEAGWKAIASDPSVQLVFCDISMPRMDGFGVLGQIRGAKEERIRLLPVIIISGDEDEATRKRVRDCGATDFISKNADATEVLSRIDTQLRLIRAKQDASDSRKAVAESATHDPLTGAFTLHYLLTEARKHYAYARRHGSLLSVVTLRIDSHRRIAGQVGREVADQVLAKIANAIQAGLRAEDSMGRSGDDMFTVLLAGTSGQQAGAFARRLHQQLGKAQINYQGQPLRIEASIGLAALGADTVSAVEELLRLASSRLGQAMAGAAQSAAGPAPAGGLPPEVERALQVLERVPADRMGDAAVEVLRRLAPLLQAACKRLRVDAPAEVIVKALQRAK